MRIYMHVHLRMQNYNYGHGHGHANDFKGATAGQPTKCSPKRSVKHSEHLHRNYVTLSVKSSMVQVITLRDSEREAQQSLSDHTGQS